LRRDLVRQIRLLRPEVVVCGDPTAWFHGNRYINHPDHRAAAQVALEAIFPCAEMELLWPELGAAHKVHAVYLSFSGQAEVHVDVTDTVDAKIAALKCHASQMGDWDPGDMVRAWAAEGAQAARREAQAARKAGKKSKGGKKVKGSKQDRKDTRERAGAEDGEAERPQYVESFRVMLLKADVAAS